jgi:hypothetical protein
MCQFSLYLQEHKGVQNYDLLLLFHKSVCVCVCVCLCVAWGVYLAGDLLVLFAVNITCGFRAS